MTTSSAEDSKSSRFEAVADQVLRAGLVGFAGSMPVSIAFCQISLGISCLAWLAKCWSRRRWLGFATGLELPLGLMLGAFILSSALSPKPWESFLGLKKLYLALALFLTAYTSRSFSRIKATLSIFLYFASLTGAYGIIMYLLGGQARLTGTQTMALTAGGIYMMAGLLTTILAVEGKVLPRWLSIIFSLILASSVVLSQSAGSLLSYAVALVSVLVISKKWKVLTAISALLVLISVVFLTLPSGKDSTVEIQKTNTWQLRKTIWQVGCRVIAERPVTGHGLVDLGEAYHRNREPWDLERDPWGAWNYGHLHNNFLQITAISGLVGLAAFGFMLYSVLKTGIRAWAGSEPEIKSLALAAMGATIGFIVNGLTEWNFGDSEIVTIFWFTAGMMAALDRMGRRSAGLAIDSNEHER